MYNKEGPSTARVNPWTTTQYGDEQSESEEKTEKEEEEEEISKKTSYWLTIEDWAENTLWGGIPHAARKKSYIWKIYWFGLFVTGAYFTVSGITKLLQIYTRYPVSVNINMTYANKLPFPSVTVCNLNPVRLSKVSLVPPDFQILFGKIFENASEGTAVERTATLEKFHQVFNAMPYEIRMELGHRKNDTILDCIFNGLACTAEDFIEWVDPVYGTCFTFNVGFDSVTFERIPAVEAYRTGPMYGLSVDLFLDQDEYIPELNDMAGAKVVISPVGRMPFPADEGIYLHPATHTAISVRLVNITRQGFPYVSNCINVDGRSVDRRDVYAEAYNMDYYVTSCLKTCYQSYVLAECGCGDSMIPINYRSTKKYLADNSINFFPCLNRSTIACQHDVNTKFGNNQLDCNECRMPCIDASYSYSSSVAHWPNKRFLDTKLAQLVRENPHFAELMANSSVKPEDNILRFNVHFSELNTEVVYEEPTYSYDTLLSNLGGYLGLYLGISFIALFEVVQIIADLICVAFRKVRQVGKRKKKKSVKGAWETRH